MGFIRFLNYTPSGVCKRQVNPENTRERERESHKVLRKGSAWTLPNTQPYRHTFQKTLWNHETRRKEETKIFSFLQVSNRKCFCLQYTVHMYICYG